MLRSSMTINRELYLYLTKVMFTLQHSVKLRRYMVMSRDQNAGRIYSARIDNSTFERVEEFKYLGTALTNQNSFAEEIKSR